MVSHIGSHPMKLWWVECSNENCKATGPMRKTYELAIIAARERATLTNEPGNAVEV